MDYRLQRISAFLAYLLPILGWLNVVFFQRKSAFAMFHTRQAIGLWVFLLGSFGGWLIIGYILSWIPFGFLVGISLFSLVILALGYGVVAWITGMLNALHGKVSFLPVFGKLANRISI